MAWKKAYRNWAKAVIGIALCLAVAAVCSGCRSSALQIPEAEGSDHGTENSEVDKLEWLSDRAETDGYSSEYGYYRMISKEDCSVNLYYIDFETGQEIYLCNRPNCPHDDDSCPSWFPFSNGVMLPIPVGEKLVILHGGNPTYAQTLGEDALAKVEIADIDGGNRREVIVFSGTEQISQLPRGGLARDSQNLYFVLTDTVETVRTLYKLDTVSGTAAPVYVFGEPEEKIVAAVDDELVIAYVPGADDLTADASALKTELFRLDPETGKETALFRYPFTSQAACDGETYAVLDENGTMQTYDLRTGKLLVSNRLKEPIDFSLSQFYGCVDGKMLVSTFVLPDEKEISLPFYGEMKYRAIDIQTGNVTELPFIYYEDSGDGIYEPAPYFVAAEYGDKYMCCWKAETLVVNFPKNDGTTIELPYGVPSYAMISKKDFWNGNEDFTIIDDTMR